MSLHVDDHDGSDNDHPLMGVIAIAVVLILTCAAILYMGNTFRVAPSYIARQPLGTPL
ncbi:MAG TPA: hypothetical protein VGC26_03610 [Afipia sp.]